MLDTKRIIKMREKILGNNVENLENLHDLEALSNFYKKNENTKIKRFRELNIKYKVVKEANDVELGGSTK